LMNNRWLMYNLLLLLLLVLVDVVRRRFVDFEFFGRGDERTAVRVVRGLARLASGGVGRSDRTWTWIRNRHRMRHLVRAIRVVNGFVRCNF
jgi:hypothetical protein